MTSSRSASCPTAGGCSPPTTRSGWPSPVASCRRSSRWPSPAARCCPWAAQRAGTLSTARARGHPPRARRGGRGAADAARPVRRGRHHAGPAGDGRHPLCRGGRAGQRGQHGQGVHEADLQGPRACRSARSWSSATATGSPPAAGQRGAAGARRSASGCWTPSPSWAGRSSSSQPGAAPASARPRRPTWPGCTRRSRRRGATTGKSWSSRPSPGREIECAVLEGVDGGAAGHQHARASSWWTAARSSSTSRRSTWTTRTGCCIPAPIPAEHLDEVRRLAAAAFEAVSGEGLARVDFFYTPGRADPAQRDQHDPWA